ncbi:type II toxin-antitoxin system HipA family toxin [Devosia psychrophila]|uniref:Serine/threonine-protein kinase HipA n=1 Tax=Devosia psychrophila TaxID=728005 RepID=A0A1I1JBI6_9HYPH|nr:HipA domain-containing protein [Devosia psychrophila]SFC43958.1 serine/threonine-protein kinase HipA [Devosia psychrophila]
MTGGTRFTYGDGWTGDIACCFPATQREHNWANGLHPFFQHLGPEGWLREKQARGAHIQDEQNDFALLLAYGEDCIGAVGIRASEEADIPKVEEGAPTPGKTLSGVQKKLLVVKDGDGFVAAGRDGPAPYIAKFNSEAREGLVRNEFLSLQWAAKILGKNEVTQFKTGHFGEEIALIVSRFDRTEKGEKLRLEDFAQVLVKPRGVNYDGKYGSSYEEVARVIREHSARPVIDLDKLFRRLVVFAALANCDAHLKNFSLLETPEGLRLSPVYDVLNTAIYDDLDRNFGLSILGRSRNLEELNGTLFRKFGAEIGLHERAVELALGDLKKQIGKNPINAPSGEPPNGFVSRFEEVVRNQCLRLFEE